MNDIVGLQTIRNLDYTILLCDDIDSMRVFYTEVMGFEVHREIPGRWIEMKVGSSLIALRLRSRPYDGASPDAATASLQFAFRVPPADVDAAAAQLADKGIELLEPVADLQPFGHRAFFFTDPEHNIIEIFADIWPDT
ncbi:MAG: glyoxalase/bleomycin resistance/dioxygenase family protein [Actinobacteria bacterium]|nr:glyoxalase/bleomycin resistance/dioxygenase family protein [Actinomycetota bacterium]